MLTRTLLSSVSVLFFVAAVGVVPAWAQDSEDTIIDTIRVRDTISGADQDRIRRWVADQIDQLTGAPDADFKARLGTFREAMRTQHDDARNTSEFRLQLAAKVSAAAVEHYGRSGPDPVVSHAMAQVLLDMARIEVLPGLQAGLKSTSPVARLLSARAMGSLKAAIGNDRAMLDAVVAALREAGQAETSGPVLSRIYEALSYSGQAAVTVSAYFDIFDRRLERRRGSAIVADGAERAALEFFRTSGVVGSLSPAQRTELAQRLAVFLRLDGQRYVNGQIAPPANPKTGDLGFYERDALERSLVANEAVLILLVPGQPATIATELRAGGFAASQAILARVYAWVGDPNGDAGVLNAGPWNVAKGAP